MDNYLKLIEFLKEDYSNVLRNDDEEIIHFDDSNLYIEREEQSTGHHIWQYTILNRKSREKWAFLVAPVSVLYAVKMKRYREQLLQKYSITGIFTIKNSFFKTSTIPSAVILLGNSEGERDIWLTSVTSNEDIVSLLKDISDYKRKVYYTKMLDASNFMPEFYNGERRNIDLQLNRYETKKLQDLAEIISGKNASRDSFSEHGIPYLRGRNLVDGKIKNITELIDESKADIFSFQLLEEGDIILQKHFGYHKIAYVTKDDIPAIASSGLIIIRAIMVSGQYLYKYITSETGKKIFDKQLSKIEKGVTIPSIGVSDLRELRIPVFDDETMQEFCDIETIKFEDLVSISRQVSAKSPAIREGELENKIYSDLKDIGWGNDVLKEVNINISRSELYRADILLLNNKELKLPIAKMGFAP